jgi:hypothetical protein
MLKRVLIKSYRFDDPSAAVLGADVFLPLKGHKIKSGEIKKRSYCCKQVLNALSDGLFCGLITDLEYGKVRNIVGESNFYSFLEELKKPGIKARLFEIMIAGVLDEYRRISAYERLFKIAGDGNLHMSNMTSIIAAVELKKPIVSYDDHFWIYQNHIRNSYVERHGEKNFSSIFTPHDFYKLFLPKFQ